jgi:hypothetical protein
MLTDAQVATLLDQCLASQGSAVEHAVAVLVELAKVACKQLKDSNAGFVILSLSRSLAISLTPSLSLFLSKTVCISSLWLHALVA